MKKGQIELTLNIQTVLQDNTQMEIRHRELDIVIAELLAILQGLHLSQEQVFAHVLCYTASLLRQSCKEAASEFHTYATNIQDMKEMLQCCNCTGVSF